MEIVKTRKERPPRILIHADHGLGKSSLAAEAPDPIFINIEDGLDEIDTNALPKPETFDDVLEQLTWVYTGEHDFKTLAIDSLDWLETLVNKHVCKEGGKESISDFGFGAGFEAAHTQFNRVVRALTSIRNERNMAIILLCHSSIKEYKNPMGDNYDTYKLKLRDKNAELFQEFVTLIGYLHFKVYVKKEDKGFSEQTKAIGGSERVLSCSPNAAYTAKNRYNITSDIEIPDPAQGWDNLINAIKAA